MCFAQAPYKTWLAFAYKFTSFVISESKFRQSANRSEHLTFKFKLTINKTYLEQLLYKLTENFVADRHYQNRNTLK